MEYGTAFIIKTAIAGTVSAIGGLAAAAALFTFLLKNLLNKDLKSFETSLAHTFDLKIEEIKNAHALRQLEHATIFKIQHEKRVDLITQLYSQLVDCHSKMNRFVSAFVPAGSAPENERGSEAADSWNALHAFYQRHRIFFTADECATVDTYIRRLKDIHIDFNFRKFEKDHIKKWIDLADTLDNDVEAIRTKLELNFRQELGIGTRGHTQ